MDIEDSDELVCETCILSNNCKMFGASPYEVDEGTFKCRVVCAGKSWALVAIPSGLIVEPKNGNVTGVNVGLKKVEYRSGFWKQLTSIFRK